MKWLMSIIVSILFAFSLTGLCFAQVCILGGVGWHIKTFPLLAGAYLIGQYLGGNIYTQLKRRNLQKYIPADSSFCDCSIDFSLEAP